METNLNKLNSSWEMNRIGLIDFWYYDDEVFNFEEGRLLLRGSNGSGKSVTMQSFIPLLLDGNMRPERLDPFGSKARRIENYLFEEGDERQERVAYLYLEFKRKDSETYATIGIGLRGRKNKRLDSWYFFLGDGRRLGKDFFLYKMTKEKICLTKKELSSRLGTGGKVFDAQNEYMDCVNRKFFGFENTNAYKELLDLLIQVRRPKLSKDFQPTLINEILENSLKSLSDEDLRPLSESIENMETYQTNLDHLKDCMKAIQRIYKIYKEYNQRILYDRSHDYRQSLEEKKALTKKEEAFLEKIKEDEEIRENCLKKLDDLTIEKEALKINIDNLGKSDMVELGKKQIAIEKQVEDAEEEIKRKEASLELKKNQGLDREEDQHKNTEMLESLKKKILEILREMESHIDEIHFNEHFLMQDELLKNVEMPYSFALLEKEFRRLEEQITEGTKILHQIKFLSHQKDQALKELDEAKNRRSRMERELMQAENQLVEIKNETIEKTSVWKLKTQEFKLPEKEFQLINTYMEGFDENSESQVIKTKLWEAFRDLAEMIEKIILSLKNDLDQMGFLRVEKAKELNEWKELTEAEPKRSQAVLKHRKHLKAQGIPFKPFYKLLDFSPKIPREKTDILEEVLMEMGLLDALIIPIQFKERVLKNNLGECDRFIFSDDTMALKENLSDLLIVDSDEMDLIFSGEIKKILEGIGLSSPENQSWIDTKGYYGLGVLHGTVSKQYQGKYIGEKQRQRFKEEMIKKLSIDLESLDQEIRGLKEKEQKNEERLSLLKSDYENFPSLENLTTAFNIVRDQASTLDRVVLDVLREEEKVKHCHDDLVSEQEKMIDLCDKTQLKQNLDTFISVGGDLKIYRDYLSDLRHEHENLIKASKDRESFKNQLEAIEMDLDNLRYDLGILERKNKSFKKQIEDIKIQLGASDYKLIQKELEESIKRLNEIPDLREKMVAQKQKMEDDLKNNKEKCQVIRNDFEKEICRLKILEEGFLNEYDLAYVTIAKKEELRESPEKLAVFVGQKLQEIKNLRGKERLRDLLQQVLSDEKASLGEYKLKLFEINDRNDQETGLNFRRLDLNSDFRGKKLKFKELHQALVLESEEQNQLLKKEEQRLFQDIMADTISKKIRIRIVNSQNWVTEMNKLMDKSKNSSGFKLSLHWKSKGINDEKQLDAKELIRLLQRDAGVMKKEDQEKLMGHFRSKIKEAQQLKEDTTNTLHAAMKEVLDYRKWFEFQLHYSKTGERTRELTNTVFFRLSGGEKALSMYVPLFSAVLAKYQGCRSDAPRLISLDEAFAGIDENNIRNIFELLVNFDFGFILNSQNLWGDYDTVPRLAIYQLLRSENVKFITLIPYVWNGQSRKLRTKE